MMDGRFRMEGDHRCTRLGKIIKVDFRMLGHEMHIERKCRMLSERFDDGASESQIRHEVTVHHIDVEGVDRVIEERNLLLELIEIHGHQGR